VNNPAESEVVRADCSTVKHRSKRAFAQVRGTGHDQNPQSTGQSTGHTGQYQQNPRSEHRSEHRSTQVGARAPGPPPSLEGGRWLEPVTNRALRRAVRTTATRSLYWVDRPHIVITMPRTYTTEEKTVALATYAEHGLARAHDEHDIPKATLRKWAIGAGMDTSAIAGRSVEQTQAASAARSARCEVLRLELREGFLVAAADMLDRLDEEHVDFRGQQAREVTFPKAPADACRNYVTAAAILIDKYRLEVGEATDRSETLALERSAQSDERLAKVVELVTERQAVAS
jgi:hypothetical protein